MDYFYYYYLHLFMHWQLKKIKNFIIYDFWYIFKNFWRFKKEIIRYRPWDYTYSLSLFRKGLEGLHYNILYYGIEIDSERLKKLEKIQRAIELIKYHEDDLFLELAEKELGYEYYYNDMFFKNGQLIEGEHHLKNKALSNLSIQIEKKTWNELFEILKGQDYNLFDKNKDFHSQTDGSGLKGWWN